MLQPEEGEAARQEAAAKAKAKKKEEDEIQKVIDTRINEFADAYKQAFLEITQGVSAKKED